MMIWDFHCVSTTSQNKKKGEAYAGGLFWVLNNPLFEKEEEKKRREKKRGKGEERKAKKEKKEEEKVKIGIPIR